MVSLDSCCICNYSVALRNSFETLSEYQSQIIFDSLVLHLQGYSGRIVVELLGLARGMVVHVLYDSYISQCTVAGTGKALVGSTTVLGLVNRRSGIGNCPVRR